MTTDQPSWVSLVPGVVASCVTVLTPFWLGFQWYSNKSANNSQKTILDQNNLLDRLEAQNSAQSLQISELQGQVERGRDEVHQLRNLITRLVGQLERAGLPTPPELSASN